MTNRLKSALLIATGLLLLSGCARQETDMKYPRKPADNPERKSGLPMLIYEAAEEDADINTNVIVIPPQPSPEKQ